MKKKIVSLFVFVMMAGMAQVYAQESAVENGVASVDNPNLAPVVQYLCVGDEDKSMHVSIEKISSGEVGLKTVVIENVPGLAVQSIFTTEEINEKSVFFNVYKYALSGPKGDINGEFSVTKKTPIIQSGFCGRAGCTDDQPTHFTSYKAVLKIYENEITFTCQ
jgi:hypothetical protein